MDPVALDLKYPLVTKKQDIRKPKEQIMRRVGCKGISFTRQWKDLTDDFTWQLSRASAFKATLLSHAQEMFDDWFAQCEL